MSWNDVKIMVEKRSPLKCKPRQIWWAYVGENIGEEQNGKGGKFLRPVLILKTFSKALCLAIPLTTKSKKGSYFYSFQCTLKGELCTRNGSLHHTRPISTKRLLKKFGNINSNILAKIQEVYSEMIFK